MIQVKKNISLSSLSTFGIGGNAQLFLNVKNSDEFILAVRYAHEKNLLLHIFAGGSNVVFPDEGLSGLTIQIRGGEMKIDGNSLTVDAGVLLSDVIDRAIGKGLSGLEKLSGIPGTVGGSVVGNAGAYGRSIGDAVEKVYVFDTDKSYWLTNKDCQFVYRDSIFKHKKLFLLQARLNFQKGNKEDLLKTSKEIIALRQQKYKPGIKCPGSFFKNVLVSDLSADQLANIDQKWIKYGKIPAGYLLEEVGAKGMKMGGIEVAEYHGNLLLNNTGKGTAIEVKELANLLKKKVKEKIGIELEEEVRYM